MEFRFSPFEIVTGTGALFLCLVLVCVFVEAPALQAAIGNAARAAVLPGDAAAPTLYWVAVEPRGRRVLVSGAAADETAKRWVLERVARSPGVGAVEDHIAVVGAAGSCQRTVDAAMDERGIRFRNGQAELADASMPVLSAIAQALGRCSASFEIAAHTGARGDAAINQRLSQRRADAVARLLAQQGIEPARLRAVGYGEAQSGADANGARIEFRVLGAPPGGEA